MWQIPTEQAHQFHILLISLDHYRLSWQIHLHISKHYHWYNSNKNRVTSMTLTEVFHCKHCITNSTLSLTSYSTVRYKYEIVLCRCKAWLHIVNFWIHTNNRTTWNDEHNTWLRATLSNGTVRSGDFLAWRQKQSWLPKWSTSLKITWWTSKKGCYVSESYTTVRPLQSWMSVSHTPLSQHIGV